ncbi:MAG TPA: hypothetical protein VF743_04545, partial [Acidimicrobiales bacterium]
GGAELVRGRLARAWAAPEPGGVLGRPGRRRRRGEDEASGALATLAAELLAGPVEPPPAPGEGPVPLEVADELACVGAWLERNAHRVRLVHVEGELSEPVGAGVPQAVGEPPVAATA